MMNQRGSLIKNIVLLFCALVLLSLALSLVSSLLWVAIKILVPVALVVWLLRIITNGRCSRRRYF